ncbi:hypothetical protein Ahy_A07g033724 [Arachis hypogaea]|uniref:SWIM-type domain-containing protein n=1 Tax=Arachis hypogaea TaxID=3818 RepID=A0A445C9Z2_ARAHY|nr:hypothetical protein Ahy_A07g033724 [Arachis hypogaea]
MEEDGYDGDSFNQAPGNFSKSSEAGLLSGEDVFKLEFGCPREATVFYEEYSRAKGFAIRHEKKLKNKKGEFVRYTYLCNRQAHMDSLRQVGISIPKIYESFAAQAGRFNLVPFTKRDLYNEVRRQRLLQNGDVNAALRVLEGAALVDEKLFWRYEYCVDFLKDNEEELNFRSSYGIPVLQTEFPELEKSGAMSFTREIFSRYRESLKRCVRVSILECIEREDGCIYVTQKYRKPQMRWNVHHLAADNSFRCSCLKIESFGLPCVHILAVLDDAAQESLSCRAGDDVALYRSRVGSFLQHCKCFAKVACVREEDFKHYVEKVVRDTHMLEERSMLESHGAETSNIAKQGELVKDPIGVRMKGTGRSNDPVGMRGVKRRRCSTCGCVGYRRTRCPNRDLQQCQVTWRRQLSKSKLHLHREKLLETLQGSASVDESAFLAAAEVVKRAMRNLLIKKQYPADNR